MRRVDLRSDTVTLPSPAMREAMYHAELGDDVMGEDPTVNRLQEMAAQQMGKEAGLFVASGTMGNLVALLTHCGRGQGVIMGDSSHTFLNEGGGSSALAGVYVLSVPTLPDGTIEPDVIEAAIPTPDVHHVRARLVCLENTHNYKGGMPLSAEYTATVADLAHRHGMSLHLDGARIFNAALALGVEAKVLAAPADSVMFCLSKGLSCPVGSMLCGSAEFIERALPMRKMVGGGMRQAGVLAAAGIVALEQMVDRMQEDHDNARLLAEGIADIPGLRLDQESVSTNIVLFSLVAGTMTEDEYRERLGQEGVWMSAIRSRPIRAVTHYGIERDDIEYALQVMRRVMSG
ncbi:MAG: threonine aldolase [Anaerolineae bacterium SM23_84]|nr:MAG: threonine aldolase [Anaerolineae bacterium SM23_84]